MCLYRKNQSVRWMCASKVTDLETVLSMQLTKVQCFVNKTTSTCMYLLNQHIHAFQSYCILSNWHSNWTRGRWWLKKYGIHYVMPYEMQNGLLNLVITQWTEFFVKSIQDANGFCTWAQNFVTVPTRQPLSQWREWSGKQYGKKPFPFGGPVAMLS